MGLDFTIVAVSLVAPAMTGMQYLLYWRHRAEFEAIGAEAIGELCARLLRRDGDELS
ncbi:hypothetical protein ACWKSP_29400 [Micromonosporaceae bacterium Da 78-11]